MTIERSTIFLETTVAEFNCSARNLDESLLIEYFVRNNCSIVNDPSKADVILVNTCAAYKKCVDYSIEVAKKRQGLNKKLIVCGCLPLVNPKLAREQMGEEVFFFSPKNMDAIDDFFPSFEVKLKDVKDANDIKPQDKADKESVFIRVARGCFGNCSYCSIKHAVGRLKSKSIEAIEDEFKILIKNHTRVVLVSEDLGAYGIDIRKTLPDLVRRLLALANKETIIYLSGVNTPWFLKYKNEFLEIFKSDHIEKSFGVALQSGSDRIRRLMKRQGKLERLEEAIVEFRNAFPGIYLSSCFIIGFPTETDEDFEHSLNLMRKKYFNYLGIFKYYESENMDSCHIKPKVDTETIEERTRIVSELLKSNNTQFRVG
jgi:MiaB/RimO family radical SAM methylthiotransferase